MSTAERTTLVLLAAWMLGFFVLPRDALQLWGSLPILIALAALVFVGIVGPVVGWTLRALRL